MQGPGPGAGARGRGMGPGAGGVIEFPLSTLPEMFLLCRQKKITVLPEIPMYLGRNYM